MSERLTSISLPGSDAAGWVERGRVPAGDMIATYRNLAARQLREAREVLDAPDDAFRITTQRGIVVQRDRQIIQPGREAGDPR